MKLTLFVIGCLFSFVAVSQNIQILYDAIPYPATSCEETFKTAELEWEKMTLDNDSIFNKVKSWAPGGELKNFAGKVDKLQAYIEHASENNSFSLSAPPSIDKETMRSIEQLSKIREGITKSWNSFKDPITNINSGFVVPNDIDNGCDQMQSSIQLLNSVSGKITEQIAAFKTKISGDLIEFQNQFDELNKLKNPMVNNQILDEMSNLLSILNEISNVLNFHYKNMVETQMVWHNAFCK